MKIEKIELCNFRSASKVEFNFEKQLNLFVGINGSGKSTILDALSICLSWLVKRIEKENGRGSYISDSSLRNNQNQGFLDIHVTKKQGSSYRWFLTKTAKGKSSNLDSQFEGVSKLATKIKASYEDNFSYPVIAYYPVNRVVAAISPQTPSRDSIYNLDVYENALGGKANYQSFFEWFRLQDDILNEKAMSRSKWISQNRNWIKSRIDKQLRLLQDCILSNDRPSEQNEANRNEFEYIIKHFKKESLNYEEPQFLFRELLRLIDTSNLYSREDFEYEKTLRDLDYMFHKMNSLSREFKDNFIEKEIVREEIFEQIIWDFRRLDNKEHPNKKMIFFLWEAFNFANLLSLWWLSDKGKRELEREFSLLSQEVKSWNVVTKELSGLIGKIVKREALQIKNAYNNEGQELKTIAQAIEKFIPEYQHLRVKRTPRPHMLIDKNEETFNLEQLSDGEKNLIALVGDIARRLAIANPRSKKPLEGEGVILIDEIDLHLHPRWQRLVIPKMLEVFPNCQFFISTHSPQVISHVVHKNIFLLKQTEEGLEYAKALESYGKNTDRILEDLLDVPARPLKEKQMIHELFVLIQKGELKNAKKIVTELKALIGDDPEFVKASVLIKRKEIIGK